MSKKKLNLYLITLCLYFVFFETGVDSTDAGPVLPETSYSIPREIQYSFTLQNKSNHLLNKAEFWTYAPVKETSTQHCLKLEASRPYELILDDLGNQILYFRFDDLPPYSTKIITIKATLTLSEMPNPISMGNINAFLRADKYIEIDNPELFQFSKNFKDLTPVKTAENIFRWVADNVYYAGYMRDERGALYALKNKRGDCTEFMYLFAALCRANNIPARGIGGYVCAENTILKPGSYHNWAEFYDDGSWKIADPQKKSFMQNQSHYIATRIIGESAKNPMGEYNRFRFEGEGLKVTMN
jgi:transglutaminase-like putative cysteine protease